MSNVLIEYNTMANIADSIRALTGTTGKLKPGEMPVVIANVNASGEDTLGEWLSGNLSTYRIKGDTVSGSMLNSFYSGPPITLDCYEATNISGPLSPGNNCTVLMPMITDMPSSAFYSFKHLDIPNVMNIAEGALNDSYGTVNMNSDKILHVGNNGLRAGSFSNIYFPNCEYFGIFNSAYNNGIKSVNLPKANTAFDSQFYSDYLLTDVDMPMITAINRQMFYGCGQYAGGTEGTMQFNNAVTVGNNAFERIGGNCASINVVLPNCTSINSGAFYYSGNDATHTLYAPKVTNLGVNVFTYANGFKSLNFPSLVNLNPLSFTYAYCLKELSANNASSVLSGSGSSIMPNLTTLYIPNATDIAAQAFNAAYNLITLNAVSVKNIECNAFSYANKLAEFNLPNVTFINTNALASINSRTVKLGESVPTSTPNFNGTPLYYANISALFLYYNSVVPVNIVKNANISLGIFVPDDMVAAYKANSSWASYNVFGISEYDAKNVGDIVFLGDTIPDSAYYTNSSIYTFTGNNVVSVGNNAFMSTTRLYSISLPNVTSVGSNAFTYGALTMDLVLPKLRSIGNGAFYYCNAPGIIVNELRVAAPNAFQYANFANIYAPNLIDVEEGAFYACGAPNIYTPNVANIANNGYAGARTGAGYIEAPVRVGVNGLGQVAGIKINSLESLKTAGNNSFSQFNGILPSPLNIPNLSAIPNSMFEYSAAVPSDVLITNATSIGSNAFCYCNSMVNIYAPNVKSIEINAFKGCQKLMNIYTPNCTSFGANMLTDCYYAANNGGVVHCDSLVEVHNNALYPFNNASAIINLNWANLKYIGHDAFGPAVVKGHTANECPKLEYCYLANFIDVSNDIVLPNIKGLGGLNAINVNMNVPNVTTFESNTFTVTPDTYLYAPSAHYFANNAISCTDSSAVANIAIDYANITYAGYGALNFKMSDANLLAVLNSGATTYRPFINNALVDCMGADINININSIYVNGTYYHKASINNAGNVRITPTSINDIYSLKAANVTWVGTAQSGALTYSSDTISMRVADTATFINGAYPDGLCQYAPNYIIHDCNKQMTLVHRLGSSYYGDSALKNLTLINCKYVPNIYNCHDASVLDLSNCNAVCIPSNMYNTPFNSGTGNIYVPADLVDAYKADTNWIACGTNVINCISTK